MDMEYEKTFEILMRDCDRYRRLKPAAALAMFQDCSETLIEGWGVGLEAMLARGAGWVAAKIGCDVERLPRHGDTVTVRGYACRSRGAIHPFRYRMEDRAGRRLVTCCAMWVLVDMEARSMLTANVPSVVLPSPEPEDAHMPRMTPIEPEPVFETVRRRALFTDTDMNGHLTNTRYLDWVCDLPGAAYHESRETTGFRIDYRSEIAPDEEAVLEWAAGERRIWCRCPGRFDAEIRF